MKSFLRPQIALAIWLCCSVAGPPCLAEVLISELMFHPAPVEGREPVEAEFIELWNRGNRPASLAGWQFDRGIRFTFPDVTLEPGAFLVLARSPSFHGDAPPFALVGPFEGTLSNGGETLRLVDASGSVQDEVRYADEGNWAQRRQVNLNGQLGWTWVAPADGDGGSLELIDPHLPNGHGHNWAPSLIPGGTPGTRNSRYQTPTAPLIDQVRHHPALPHSREPVVVRATVASLLGKPPAVSLHYRVSALDPSDFHTLPMVADDHGTFMAEIPPHANGTVVEFFVRAEVEARARTWPAPTRDDGYQGANALYQVNDNLLPSSSNQPFYGLVMTVDEDLRFRPDRFPAGSNASMNATFVASRDGDTIIRYQASLRRRGNGSRSRNPRSFRLNLPADAPWRSATGLNLVAQYTYLQVLGLRLFHEAGLPAPQAWLVQLHLNGVNYANENNRYGVHYGSYAHLQPLDGTFVDRNFPEDAGGDLYRKVSANPSRDQKRWGVHFGDQVVYRNPGWYHTDRWTKETNGAANDWSRFQEFIVTMNEAAPETYFEEVSSTVHLDQWLRWFALMVLMNNRETNLSNGIDDDYSLYQGLQDPRVQLLPHDLDTIFGLGDTSTEPDTTLFPMLDSRFGTGASVMPQLQPFFEHPLIRPAYFEALHDLMESVLHPDRFEAMVHRLLPHVPLREQERMLTYNRARRAHVRSLIDAPIAISTRPGNDGLYHLDTLNLLEGTVGPRKVTSVRVQGLAAAYDRGRGVWSMADLEFSASVRSLLIEALDENQHTVSAITIPIAPPSVEPRTLFGELTEDFTLEGSSAPYRIRDTLVVPEGVTLTLAPNTTLHFDAGAGLTVRGRLHAAGTEQAPILLTGSEGGAWAGLHLSGPSRHVLRHLSLQAVSATQPALTLMQTFAEAHHLRFDGLLTERCLVLDGASIHLFDSVFPTGANPSPIAIDSQNGLLPDHATILARNQFGSVRFRERPPEDAQLLTFTDNHFHQTDTALVLEGTADLRGNRFENVDTAILHSHGSLLLANNRASHLDTFLSLTESAEVTLEQSLLGPAMAQCFHLAPEAQLNASVSNTVFEGPLTLVVPEEGAEHQVRLSHCYLPSAVAAALDSDDHIQSEELLIGPDLSLPALEEAPIDSWGTHGQALGPVSMDMPFLSPRPLASTGADTLSLRLTGSGWTQLDYRLDGGPWNTSALPRHPTSTAHREVKLTLEGLAAGEHVLEIREQNGAPVNAIDWTVEPARPTVRLNEITALPTPETHGEPSEDWVELINTGNEVIDLSGYQLQDGGEGESFTLPQGLKLEPLSFLTLHLSAEGDAGFALNRDGDALTLASPDGTILDAMSFGSQIEGRSLGRHPHDPNQWILCHPTPSAKNAPAAVGTERAVRLNELYTASNAAFREEFVELFHQGHWPVDIGGLALINGNALSPPFTPFPQHSYLAPGELYLVPDPMRNFSMNSWFETLTLFNSASGTKIDQVSWDSQSTRKTFGRVPDGHGIWLPLDTGTPGRSNGQGDGPSLQEVLIPWESPWHFYQEIEPPRDGWHLPAFDDSPWEQGPAAFFRENADLAVPKRTPLRLNPPFAHAFRQNFTIEDPSAFEALSLQVLADDGVAVYLNGHPVLHQRLPASVNGSLEVFATDGISNAAIEGPFALDASQLLSGTNLLAASVHQDDRSSSDVVFAAQLAVERRDPEEALRQQRIDLQQHLRISEIMFHPAAEGDAEWLEFTNSGERPLTLTALTFVEGLSFTFPETTLPPQGHVVIVSDTQAFRRQFGDTIPMAGEFSGRLDNQGETLALSLPLPETHRVLTFRYAPEWYPDTDGAGRSLILRSDARPSSSDSADWRAGSLPGGTPGAPEPPLILSPSRSETILDDFVIFQIEATNSPTVFGAEGLPPGMIVDATTGFISGAPRNFGEFEVTLFAENATGRSQASWALHVAPSGPPTSLVWEQVPATTDQQTPFPLVLSARDAAGRLVREMSGEVDITSFVERPSSVPVVFSEIDDTRVDGFVLTKLDATASTEGWRVLLNAATESLNSIHGLGDVSGEVVRLPPTFTRLEQSEEALGFNLLWSDAPPAQREGGQRGWALLINESNEVIDSVVWGYTRSELIHWHPTDEAGRPLRGTLWKGPGIVHPGQLGHVLTRPHPLDSDEAGDWTWKEPSQLPDADRFIDPVSSMSLLLKREPFPLILNTNHGFNGGLWQAVWSAPQFGSAINLKASVPALDLVTPVAPLIVRPAKRPQVPERLSIQGNVNQWIPLPEMLEPWTEILQLASEPSGMAQLRQDQGRARIRFLLPGAHEVRLRASNPLGEVVTLLTATVWEDEDGDGMADIWESTFNFDATRSEDAQEDRDGDGMTNLAEFIAGTDPGDRQSGVRLFSLDPLAEDLELSWQSVSGGRYTLEWGRAHPSGLRWETAHGGWILTEGETGRFPLSQLDAALSPDPASTRLLRIRIWPAEVDN